MKLLVIVLCLVIERFLVHSHAHIRFAWFHNFCHSFRPASALTSWLKLLMLVTFPVLLTALILFFTGNWVFGFVGLVLNVIILHYCIGPGNPFFPILDNDSQTMKEMVGDYFSGVNGQLFAVIFWYIILGPLGALAYRLISLCQNQEDIQKEASWLTDLLEWVPAKLTALLYLLVGNFQAGYQHFSRLLFAKPEHNQTMLSLCGLEAVGEAQQDSIMMPRAETLVEHALVMLLVLLAIFTIAAWL